MQKISSRDRKVAGFIRDRKPFQTYGALRAEVVSGLSVWDMGQLSGADEAKFRNECQHIDYVVYSYATPIAWHWTVPDARLDRVNSGWHKVAQKFSMTTSHHQGKLYLIEDGPVVREFFDQDNPIPVDLVMDAHNRHQAEVRQGI